MSNRQKQTFAIFERLAETFPLTFFVYEVRRRPLQVGIANHIATKVDIRPTELRWALCSYCNSAGYLRSLQEGSARLDLAGNEAGIVTDAEAEHARQKLNEVLARRQPKPQPAPQQRREGPAAQERAPRKQRAANLDRGEVGSQRCENSSLARQSDPTLTQRQPGRLGFAELRASAAQRKTAAR
jgi:sRNA-binding protein